MFEILYIILCTIEFFLAIRIVARYVFLEPKLSKRGLIIYCFMIVCSLVTHFICGEDIAILLWILFSGASLCMARKKQRIRGFFLVCPIVGGIIGIVMPMNYVIESIVSFIKISDIYVRIVDFIIFILLLVFYFCGKAWRMRFEQELQFRKLRQWERTMLTGTGWLIFILALAVMDLQEKNIATVKAMPFYILIIYVTVFVLTISVTGFVWRGNKKSYYEGLAKINEHYLALELQHFEAYKLTQKEVRRIQHDMKHHVACLQHLCQKGSMEEVQMYLKSIGETLEDGDMEINCGHALADSICTHKGNIAAQKGICLSVKGRLPEQIVLMPVDLCTILSNALDNAIEAVEHMEESKRWIEVEMSNQGKMILFRFSNPVGEEVDCIKPGISSKEDRVRHGFGLLNIKYAIEKYNGQMQYDIEENMFVLSVIVGER